MEPITRIVTMRHVAFDCEARNHSWRRMENTTFEEAVEELRAHASAWFDGVAEVELVFDPEEFAITEIFLKRADWNWNWVLGKRVIDIRDLEAGE